MSTKSGFSKSTAPTAKNYDFKTPARFTKEQVRTLEMIHEDLAVRLSNSLPALLRTNVTLRVIHSEQGFFRDFMSDWYPQTLYHILTIAPLEGQAALVGNETLNQAVLAQLLGGQPPTAAAERNNTSIDLALLTNFSESLLNDWQASFSRLAPLKPKLKDNTTNQHWVQLSLGGEWVVLFVLEVTIKNATGALYFYYPYQQLKPLLPKLSPKLFLADTSTKESSATEKEVILENLLSTSVLLTAVLGQTKIPLRTAAQLKVGSILTLEQTPQQPVVLKVNGRNRFQGSVRRSPKGRYLVVVDKKIQEPRG